MQRLFDAVYMLEGEVAGRPLQLVYLRGDRLDLLIDTGCAGDPEAFIAAQITQAGGDPAALRMILNTHPDLDHTGGNHAMKQIARQAMLVCGTADRAACADPAVLFNSRYDEYRAPHQIFYGETSAAWIREHSGKAEAIDWTCVGGETIRLSDNWEVEVVALPGHAKGHIGIWDHKNRALYGGDAIHGAVYLDLNGRPALCPTYLHVDDYLRTIDAIGSMSISTYAGCHWPVKRDAEIASFCAESRAFVMRADALLIDLLGDGQAHTLRSICLALGPMLGDWPHTPELDLELVFALNGHAERLVSQGKARVERNDGILHYALVP